MKKILSALLLSTLCLFASAQIVNPNPPGSVNWTAPGTIGSATPNSGAFTHLTTNEVISAALNQGTYAYGTLGYTDTGLLASYTASLNGYIQVVLTNSNAGASASADYIVGNNLNTATTYYGDFGMNSSGFTGTGSMNLPNAVYVYGSSGDLVLGTQTANAVHLLANNAATDAITISSANVPTINSPVLVAPALGTPASGTITNLTGTCAACNISGSATNATNLAGGAADSIPYQTGTGATGFIAAGTNGYVLQMVSGVPAWANSSGVFNPAAVAITGGTINGTTIGATTPAAITGTSAGVINGQQYVVGGASSQWGGFTISSNSGGNQIEFGATSNQTTQAAAVSSLLSGGSTSLAAWNLSAPVKLQFLTGGIQPLSSVGIIGTTAADNVGAGGVGEYISATVSGTALTTGNVFGLTSVSLTAGDWDVWGQVTITGAASTTFTAYSGSVSVTSGVIGTVANFYYNNSTSSGTNFQVTQVTPVTRFNVSTTTPVYCNAGANFAVSTATGGCLIQARRVR